MALSAGPGPDNMCAVAEAIDGLQWPSRVEGFCHSCLFLPWAPRT